MRSRKVRFWRDGGDREAVESIRVVYELVTVSLTT